MKGIYLWSVVLIFICMVLLPLFSMDKATIPNNQSQPPDPPHTENVESFRMYLTEEDKIVNITARDYCIGVVLAEMAAEYELEALKAQSVVAYTYAKYKSNLRKDEDYDITDTSKKDQAFLSVEKAKERFGDNYNKYVEKVTSAVDSVLGQTILYDGKPILAACHSISGGKTESATDIWGGEYPYLMPVESVGDVLNPKYLTEVTVSTDDMKSALKTLEITTDKDPSKWFDNLNRTDSGTVLKLTACGTEIKGSELRTALGLRSANFDIAYSNGNFKFTVRGYGHGVGMSQYGAQFMALQGSSYQEIIKWYYTDCEISNFSGTAE